LGLKTDQFNQCLDGKKYQDKINSDKNNASEFGISGTPAIFINNKFINGVVSTDDLKKYIEDELAK
jgi:protein-disulfide isomerase